MWRPGCQGGRVLESPLELCFWVNKGQRGCGEHEAGRGEEAQTAGGGARAQATPQRLRAWDGDRAARS